MTLVIAITIFLIMIVLNGLFAGYETGFVSLDRIRLRFLSEQEKNPDATHLLHHLSKPERLITTVLIGTNIALITGTMAITGVIAQDWLAMLIVTPAFLIFAEIIPKSVFRAHPNRLSLAFLPVIRVFDFVLAPLVYPAMMCARALRHLIGSGSLEHTAVMSTEEDFRNLVDESAERGSIEPEEQEMIHSVMDLERTQAKEIMVPRIDIKAVPSTASRKELIERFQATGHTRIPVYGESIDEIIGVANVYDVLLDLDTEADDIARFAREVIHVPDTKPVDDLLQELRLSGQPLAIVTDEYGGTDGLITLEDILEEIFGEIQDEHDPEEPTVTQVGPYAYIIDARTPVEVVATATGAAIEDAEVETIAGWVMHVAGHIPAIGERIDHEGFVITVLEGHSNQVNRIRLEVPPPESNAPETETD